MTAVGTYRILITGGSGFIGTNLVEHFTQKGHSVLNLDQAMPLNATHSKYWKKVNLLDEAGLTKEVKDFDPVYVVHLAARTDLDGKTIEEYSVNTTGTGNLIRSLAQVKPRHVLLTSSMLVCRPGYIPRDAFDFAPSTVYGESKMLMEKMIREQDPPFRWQIIRPTSIWGPWFGTPYKDFFVRVLAGKMFHIGGVGSATKTYGFVWNSVHQISQLLFSETVSGNMFYIGDAPPLNISQWANKITDQLGDPQPRVIPFQLIKLAAIFGDLLSGVGVRFPMTSFRLKNMTTDNILPLHDLKAITGEDPYNLTEAIDITLKWMKKHN